MEATNFLYGQTLSAWVGLRFCPARVYLVIGLLLLTRAKKVVPGYFTTLPTFTGMREYLRVGLGSGADSLIRNVAYFFLIIRLVNTIGSEEIGGYYVAVQIFWSFMLVPVLALADSAKALVANSSGDIQRVRTLWYASMLITAAMMLVWIALTPAFPGFARALSDDAETVRWAVTAFAILFVPYVLFSFNTVSDSVFYGVGKTQYLAYQSLLTNGTVYLGAFLLYTSGLWEVSFEGVMALFSIGILVDSILTLTFLIKVLYIDPANQYKRLPSTEGSPGVTAKPAIVSRSEWKQSQPSRLHTSAAVSASTLATCSISLIST